MDTSAEMWAGRTADDERVTKVVNQRYKEEFAVTSGNHGEVLCETRVAGCAGVLAMISATDTIEAQSGPAPGAARALPPLG